jgi:hypothetical protein
MIRTVEAAVAAAIRDQLLEEIQVAAPPGW